MERRKPAPGRESPSFSGFSTTRTCGSAAACWLAAGDGLIASAGAWPISTCTWMMAAGRSNSSASRRASSTTPAGPPRIRLLLTGSATIVSCDAAGGAACPSPWKTCRKIFAVSRAGTLDKCSTSRVCPSGDVARLRAPNVGTQGNTRQQDYGEPHSRHGLSPLNGEAGRTIMGPPYHPLHSTAKHRIAVGASHFPWRLSRLRGAHAGGETAETRETQRGFVKS